jgi:septal ring factor EnvC (AmiA/AmiB activator)
LSDHSKKQLIMENSHTDKPETPTLEYYRDLNEKKWNKILKLEAENASLKAERDKLSKQNDRLEDRFERDQDKVKELQQENEKLKVENKRLQADLTCTCPEDQVSIDRTGCCRICGGEPQKNIQ